MKGKGIIKDLGCLCYWEIRTKDVVLYSKDNWTFDTQARKDMKKFAKKHKIKLR